MAENMLVGKNLTPSATGPAGPIPRRNHCTPQCYAKGKRKLARSCKCKSCHGKAHGQGKKYASEHGYLKDSDYSRKPQPDQERLFPDELPIADENANLTTVPKGKYEKTL